MRELNPSPMSSFFPDRWNLTDKHWRVWRTHQGVRSIAGDFTTKAEAGQALRSLQRLPGEFEIEFTGKSISHCREGGKQI